MVRPIWMYAPVLLLALAGCHSAAPATKHHSKWPECTPPDPKDPNGDFNNNLSVNGTPYKCSPAGKWEIDKKAEEAEREYEASRGNLLNALGTRKLTRAELAELSPGMNTFPMQPYFPCEKYAELYDLLVKQWELQNGKPLIGYNPLSKALGEYNQCPQEQDNKRAVESMIETLKQ